jgi:3-hydroxyisobutyrate dehydrogenase-like beta-hydroxyacid dehydrogenase
LKETVAVLGTGKMGTALVHAFAEAGHGVAVWNRTAAKAEPLRTVATLSATPGAAAQDALLIVAPLTDSGVCGQVLFTAEMGESLRGKTVAQLTSGTPANARTGAAWAAQYGVYYLDGAILAQPNFIATDYATVFYAGKQSVFDAHKPTLQALETTLYLLPRRSAQRPHSIAPSSKPTMGAALLSFTPRPSVSPKEFLLPGSSNTSDHS